MRDYYILKINAPAGIYSPGNLLRILKLAYASGIRKVRFGARQQLLMTVHYEELPSLQKSLTQEAIAYEVNTDFYPNLISSYCGEDVFRSGDWLRESEYHFILDQFEKPTQLKVNLSDSGQSFTPFFTGHVNFIASHEPHFWHVYIRLPKSNQLIRFPQLLYSSELGRFVYALEELLDPSTTHWLESLQQIHFIAQPSFQEVELPDFSLPYYEGFNRYGTRTWLGLYRREEWFSISFLVEVCELCLRTRIGEICSTPWKSLIIKNIQEKDRTHWSYLLGKHNISVRHASHELAWQTEDHSAEGASLKQYVIQHFNQQDTRTFGLCFGIQTQPKSEVFGSVLIRQRPWIQWGFISLGKRYDLYIAEQYNPNSRVFRKVEKGLLQMHVPLQIERICRTFSAQRILPKTETLPLVEEEHFALPTTEIYECPHCLTRYDERYGDEAQAIAAHTTFQKLPESYCCPTCQAPKSDLIRLLQEA